MKSLSELFRAAAEFDGQRSRSAFYEIACLDANCDAHSFESGAQDENARLAPLLELGAKAIELLTSQESACDKTMLARRDEEHDVLLRGFAHSKNCRRCALLTEARQLLEKGGKG